MERESPSTLHPALLPEGTVVGPWRVVAWAGRGVYGAVYRAVPVHSEAAPAVALKVALIPGDPRFAREVELLLRLRHPSIPRLWDSGEWQHPSGARYPFVAMEWVDGVPLYEWARQHPDFSAQVPRLLAQLSGALQALHAQGAVHRDVKGDNVLVRRSDSRAVLTDFGSGNYPDTVTLTPPSLYPGTPAYRAPESWLFELQFSRDASARYAAGPADDLYALGVTACRLLTGKYPEFPDPWKDESGIWRLDSVLAPAELGDVEPRLRALILRMLSARPDERGTAAQLAESFEQAAVHSLAQSPPLIPGSAAQVSAPKRARPWRPWLSTAAAGLALATWVWWLSPGRPGEMPSSAQTTDARASQPDAGTAGLAEALTSASTEASPGLPAPASMAEDTLPEPLEGQDRPDAKGRCPHKRQVALNGGCWLQLSLTREACEDSAGHMFKATCYVPVIPPRHKHIPTSSPAHEP